MRQRAAALVRRRPRLLVSVAAAAVLVALAVVAVVGSAGSSPAARPAAGAVATAPEERLPLAPCPGPGRAATGSSLLPDLVLPCLSASGPADVPLRTLTGTPTVLNLWAAWCAPCREELPAFQRLASRAGGTLRVVGVLTADAAGDGAQFLAQVHASYASLFDREHALLDALGRTGLPVTVFVGADGSVRRVYQGPPLTDASLAALVRQTLGVSP